MRLTDLKKYADNNEVTLEFSQDTGITVAHFEWHGVAMKAQSSIHIAGFYAFSIEGDMEQLFLETQFAIDEAKAA